MHLHDLMEPEETVGTLWHGLASRIGATPGHDGAAATLASVRPSLAVLFRALGGAAGAEITEAAPVPVLHRRGLRQRIAIGTPRDHRAMWDGVRLSLPPMCDTFPDPHLNRMAYFWWTALAALSDPLAMDLPAAGMDRDCAQIRANADAAARAHAACPGLRDAYRRMAHLCAEARPAMPLSPAEAMIEQAIRDQLRGTPRMPVPRATARDPAPFAPVPIWLVLAHPGSGSAAQDAAETSPPPGAATTTRRIAERRDLDQTRRPDSFILHRFESILSWVESMNIARSIHDDDDMNARKAAEDQDRITLTRHDRRAATRLRLHLHLSPSEAEHEELAGAFLYPEWNHRTRSYMPGHCRVLDAPAPPAPQGPPTDPRHVRAVRRQFDALRPRRVLHPRQVEGQELDLDALLSARADMAATGRGSDRIWQAMRQTDRDLAVAFLIDTSRSTEAALGDTSVIAVARTALGAMAAGIDAAGDRLAIWGFSSLRRDRVFLSCAKSFDMPHGPEVQARINGLRPGHYTRLGAAIRHVSAQLAAQPNARKLLIVLTDGKPNDLDHYEGTHGIEDSRMAVREARRAGLSLHGVVIDEGAQDWFPRIFGRGGFSLVAAPERLARALPDIYRTLTQES